MAPALVQRQLFRREVRVENDGRRVPAELGERFVDVRIAELVIGRVHDVARVALDAEGERPAGMSQRLG